MSDARAADRLETLLQRHLDGELAPSERDELAAALDADPAARRRHAEYVALESLLLAVASTERGELGAGAVAAGARRPVRGIDATRRVTARRAILAPLLAAAALVIVVLAGIAAPPRRTPEPALPDVAARPALRVSSLTEGHLAVAIETEDPDVQIVWLHRTLRTGRTP